MLRNIFILFSLISSSLYSQGESYNWYFGDHVGVNFSTGVPVPIEDSEMLAHEGCASISDVYGNLLFYTNGLSIWNYENSIMPNGDSLMGDQTSTQSAVIVKQPQSDSNYYVFTIDEGGQEYGFRYSIVDMSLDSNRGDVTDVKNISILHPTDEKITAIESAGGNGFWIISKRFDINTYHAYYLDSTGLDTVPVISEFEEIASSWGGYLKASHDGSKIISCIHPNTFLYDFNNENGVLSNPIELDIFISYGAEFSANGQVLYVSTIEEPVQGQIVQFDLSDYNEIEINNSYFPISNTFILGALQIGPDQKIYFSDMGPGTLSRINNPDVLGQDCNYEQDAITFTNGSSIAGLPNFFSSDFTFTQIEIDASCFPDSSLITYSPQHYDSISWDLGDLMSGIDNFHSSDSVYHSFSEPGSYSVKLIGYLNNFVDTIIQNIQIGEVFDLSLGGDQFICMDDILVLDPLIYNVEYLWQDSSVNQQYYVSDPGDYWVEVNKNNCIIKDEISVFYCEPWIMMPNIFTPNSDGVNDTFIPLGSKDVIDPELTIYNRWGLLLFNGPLEDGWDGSNVNDGVYFWVIHYKDQNGMPKEMNGSVSLTRVKK